MFSAKFLAALVVDFIAWIAPDIRGQAASSAGGRIFDLTGVGTEAMGFQPQEHFHAASVCVRFGMRR